MQLATHLPAHASDPSGHPGPLPGSNLMETADTLQITQIHPDKECFSDNILIWYKAPIAAVQAVVTVVTHHEILAGWHAAGKAFSIVGTQLAQRVLMRVRYKIRRPLVGQDVVLHAGQGFLPLLIVRQIPIIEIIWQWLVRNFFTIYG